VGLIYKAHETDELTGCFILLLPFATIKIREFSAFTIYPTFYTPFFSFFLVKARWHSHTSFDTVIDIYKTEQPDPHNKEKLLNTTKQ
jgi:hypothetical protein